MTGEAEKAWREIHPEVARSPIFDAGWAARGKLDQQIAAQQDPVDMALAGQAAGQDIAAAIRRVDE